MHLKGKIRYLTLMQVLFLWVGQSVCSFPIAPTFATSFLDHQLLFQPLIESFEVHSERSARSMLQPRHALEFDATTVFGRFARSVCHAQAIPRKELYETWATALLVQQFLEQKDLNISRIADLACGHGLLSWALLVLLLGEQQQQQQQPSLSAVCVDKRMPASAEKLVAAMMEEYSELKLTQRWDFVESKLESVTMTKISSRTDNSRDSPQLATSSTLLCGIHACGPLSDQIMQLAIQSHAPVVLVPCCHSRKCLDYHEKTLYRQQRHHISLRDFVDQRRLQRLEDAGYQVVQQAIPVNFTPQNRILLATPIVSYQESSLEAAQQSAFLGRTLVHGLRPLVTVPLDDTPEAIAVVKSLAGRQAAQARKQVPSPSFCVSLAMPHSETVTITALKSLAEQVIVSANKSARANANIDNHDDNNSSKSWVKVEHADGDVYCHPVTQQYYRTFRIDYTTLSGADRDQAKDLHARLCQAIPTVFDECQVRS